MSRSVRLLLLAMLSLCMVGLPAAAAHASFGIEKFVAVTCSEGHEKCGEEAGGVTVFGPVGVPKEPSKGESEAEGFTQAGGHVPFGITDFKVTTVGSVPAQIPTGVVTHIRTDVAAGLSTSPAVVPQCSLAEFGTEEAIPGTGFYLTPTCKEEAKNETKVGENEVTVYAGETVGDLPLSGNVYNLVQREGLASEFGVALKLPKPITEGILKEIFKGSKPSVEKEQYFAHTLIEGNVEWGKEEKGTNEGDYHDYFEVNVSPALPLIRSRLVFFGRSGEGDFITNATSCPGHNTTKLKIESKEAGPTVREFTTPIGLSGCNLVPFEPTLSLQPENTQSDQPNGATTELTLPHDPAPTHIDSSQLKTASVTLPEGMTLNESAAYAVTAHCTAAQARIHSATRGVACPTGSKVGTVTINVPGLPPGSLEGNIYLGGPETGPVTEPPYTIYLDAESARYGVSVRLKGSVVPNETTGRLTTVFSENPEQPFSTAILHLTHGAFAPLANPLVCGTAKTETKLEPFTGTAAQSPFSEFAVDGNNAKGPCLSPLPFSLTQSTENSAGNAGGHTTTTFNLVRPSGNQYLSRVRTTLPAGLNGAIPAVTQCPEAQASTGTCPSTSQVGTATVEAGAGVPFLFKGAAYLTGPYNGAPFGMSIAVPAVAGAFNLGTVVTRATINVDPNTARTIVEATLPRIVKAVGKPSSGILLRMRKISVAVNKPGFLFNPTSCSPLSTETTAYGFTIANAAETATLNLKSPFQVANCNKLKFKPSFKAASSAKTSKLNGASLETTINQAPGQANIKSITVQLPVQLPSRLTTLQQACLAATFEANPFHCPKGSFVGGVRANTPLLPNKMTGPAILVSHANLAFPDLDLVLEANGVRVILVGNTDIKNGITTTKFASTPDAPVTSATVNLPIGPHSSLAAFGNLCGKPLLMPTTLVGWNGTTIKQTNRIFVRGCPVKVLRHRVSGNAAFITVETFAGGRVSGSGGGLATVYRYLRGPARITLRVPLSGAGQRRGRPFGTKVRVGFVPSSRGEHASISFAPVRFF
jgi:hypothetical protein